MCQQFHTSLSSLPSLLGSRFETDKQNRRLGFDMWQKEICGSDAVLPVVLEKVGGGEADLALRGSCKPFRGRGWGLEETLL
ncbi:hypothetical protein E2320_006385 [Naja naja]|nr:hypothetical protein E2320_006385 [Naja naja]